MTLLRDTVTFVNLQARLRGFLVLCLALIISTAPYSAWAWSEAGHQAIAELSVRQLPAAQRKALNDTAQLLLDKIQPRTAAEGAAQTLSPVALTAAWMDTIRGMPLEQVFAHYGKQLPEALAPYGASTTDDWHYSNLFYHPNKSRSALPPCPNLNKGRLVDVLPPLKKAFVNAAHKEDKAIVLAMLVHLVADAHQPLHGVSRLSKKCQHDRGGNDFCIAGAGAHKRCASNLHRLWDSGLGVFEQNDIEAVIAELAAQNGQHPWLESKSLGFNPKGWQMEAFELAGAIYGTPEGHEPSSDYLAWGQAVARQRGYLAARRLANLLKDLGKDIEVGKGRAHKRHEHAI